MSEDFQSEKTPSLTSAALDTLKGNDSVGVGWGQGPEDTEEGESVLMPGLAGAPNAGLLFPFPMSPSSMAWKTCCLHVPSNPGALQSWTSERTSDSGFGYQKPDPKRT